MKIVMSHLPSILRPAALAVATLVLSPTSFVAGSATVAIVTAATVTASSQAEAARSRVRDHRCLPGISGKPKCWTGR